MARLSETAHTVRGALFAYLAPCIAMDARPQAMALLDRAVSGLTSQNYAASRDQLVNRVQRALQGRLAQDADLTGLMNLLDALKPMAQSSDQGNPANGQWVGNPGGGAPVPTGVPTGGVPAIAQEQGSSEDIVAKIKAYLEQEGIAPEVINNLDAFLAEHQPSNAADPSQSGVQGVQMPNGNGPNGQGGDQTPVVPSVAGGMTGAMGGADQHAVDPDNLNPTGDAAQDQAEGTEGLTEAGAGGGPWRDMEPRGGPRRPDDLAPESAGDAALAGDDVIPSEQSEQLSGVPKASSEGASSRYMEGTRVGPDGQGQQGQDQAVPTEQSEQYGGVPVRQSNGGSGGGSRVMQSTGNDSRPAQDGNPKTLITRAALDQAIRVAQDAAIRTQRAIREAERFVRPWVGDLAMDANHPADIYRATLKALGLQNVDKLHPDALRPILEAQPRPSARMAQDRQRTQIAQDAAGQVEGSYLDRFPDAAKITIQ